MHICNQIQQMCNNRNRCGITYRKERKKMMDEKTMQRIRKLQALAERGIGGEKTTAEDGYLLYESAKDGDKTGI